MNTLMWESPATRRHLRTLLEDRGDGGPEGPWPLSEAAAIFDRHATGLILAAPISKALACGDVGDGAMAEVAAIVGRVPIGPPDSGSAPDRAEDFGRNSWSRPRRIGR